MDLDALTSGLAQVGLALGTGDATRQAALGAVLMGAAALLKLFFARQAGGAGSKRAR